MLSIETEIKLRLQSLEPLELKITNDSAKHQGHASSPNNGQSHFSVFIVSQKFEGLSRVQSQRLVMDAVSDLFSQGLHALAVQTQSRT